MLTHLSVDNYALIDRLEIDFAPNLNIITGETGAGKSILLGALGLILGSRGDIATIRDVSRNCVIEGEFNILGYALEPMFEALDVDYSDSCVIRRVITPSGKSRAYVNDIPVQLTSLREIGSRLIDIHSQHQTLLLGDNSFQTNILDSVANHSELIKRYAVIFEELSVTQRALSDIRRKASESSKDTEYIMFQLTQLNEANLKDGEQEELEIKLGELTHASQIKETLLFANQTLDEDETSVLTRLKSIELSVGRLQTVYPRAEDYYTRLHSTLLEIKELNSELASEADRIEADPTLLETTEHRLDTIYTLQQKHKVKTIAELLLLKSNYETQLSGIEGFTHKIEELTIKIEELHRDANALANQIHLGRVTAAPIVENHVVSTLAQLGMPSVQLKAQITKLESLRADGGDEVRFMFTANKNSTLQPIEKVASGGEMSRLMLSLKSLIAKHSKLPTIIFDEIDSGVSGSIADSMGEIIVLLSSDIQIINITHLPQVASKGDHHFFVYKSDLGESTVTHIRKLSQEERVNEIAKMLSGSNVTDAAVKQANLLLSAK